MNQKYENIIIYLIAHPGTGKYTIAKNLADKKSEFRLVDNHLINNPLFSLIDMNNQRPIPEKVWKNQGKIWDAVFEVITGVSPRNFSFILTNSLFNSDPKDRELFKKVKETAEQRDALFIPVRLTISPEEHIKRISSPGRAERFKLTDADAPLRFARDNDLLDFEHPHKCEVDVSNQSPDDVIEIILEHIGEIRNLSPASPKHELK